MFSLELAAVSADRLRATCGDDPGYFCRQALDLTGDKTTAEAADFLIGKPLSIAASAHAVPAAPELG